MQGAAGEPPGRLARVVLGDRFAAVAAHGQPLAGQGEEAGLGPDLALADLAVAVVERQRAARGARGVLGRLGEAGRQDQVVAGGQVLGGVDPLLDDAGEVVDVVQPVVLDVERVPAEPAAVREEDALRARRPGRSTWAPMVKSRLRTLTATNSGISAPPGR